MASLDFDGDWGKQYAQTVDRIIPGYHAIFPMALALLKMCVPDQGTVLVVGAGGGAELCAFAREPWQITGVDPSQQMLRACEEALSTISAAATTRLVRGYVSDLPEDPSFDAVTCILVMHFLPDDGSKLQLLEGVARRMKPGATYIHVDGYGNHWSDDRDLARSLAIHYLAVTRAFRDHESLLQFLRASAQGHPVSERRMIALFEEAGFTGIQQFYQAFFYGGWIMKRR